MSDLNRVVLIGRLTRDADLKFIQNGTAVSKFSIAVNRSVKHGDSWDNEPSFIDIVLWGKQAESLNQYLLKGKQVGIDGEIRQDRWNDEKSGQQRSRIEIVANRVQLLGGGNSSDDSGQSGGSRQQSRSSRQPTQSYQRQNDDGFTDDIPF